MSKSIYDPSEKRQLLREAIRDELNRETPEDGISRLSPSDRRAFCDDQALGRVLRASNGSVDNAKKLLTRTLEWRGKCKGMHRDRPFSVSEFDSDIDDGDTYIAGSDSDGRAVLVIRGSTAKQLDPNKYLRYLTFILESACAMMKDRNQEQWVCIIDLSTGFTSQAPLSFSLELLRILSDFYTERLYRAIVVDAPSLFSFLWASISPFLEETTKKKINFTTSKDWTKRASVMSRQSSSVARISENQGDEEVILGGSPQSDMKRTTSFWSSLSLPRSRSDGMLQEASKVDRTAPYYEFYEKEYDKDAHRALLLSLGWRE